MSSVPERLRKELAELYSGPPEDFTSARNELAKRLREKGETDAADSVRALKRPTAAAAIVNRLVMREPKRLSELLEAGDALRAAQSQVLEGSGSGDELRLASERMHRAVDALVEAAKKKSAGDERPPSAQTIQKVAETLEAVSSDPETRTLVEEGRLDKERRSAAFGIAAPPSAGGAKGGKASRADSTAELERQLDRRRSEEESIRAELEANEASVAERTEALEEARQQVSAAREELKAVQAAARDMARRLRAAERETRAVARKLGR